MRNRAPYESYRNRPGGLTKPIHQIMRQDDEYACKCGARWPVSDGKEHP